MIPTTEPGGHPDGCGPCGKATWWELESIPRAVIAAFIYDKSIDVNAECEVPRDESGRRGRQVAVR